MFNEEQIKFAKEYEIELKDNMSDSDIVNAIDVISDLMLSKGFDDNYEQNDFGTMCESIIDILSDM